MFIDLNFKLKAKLDSTHTQVAYNPSNPSREKKIGIVAVLRTQRTGYIRRPRVAGQRAYESLCQIVPISNSILSLKVPTGSATRAQVPRQVAYRTVAH